MTEIAHSKGEKIYCIANDHLIGELNKDVYPGQNLNSESIKWEEGMEVLPGGKFICNNCRSPFINLIRSGFIKFNIK